MKKSLYLILALAALLPNSAMSFYNSSTGRWLNRDPIAERGGRNTFCFIRNDAINFADKDGRITIKLTDQKAVSPTDCGSFWAVWDISLGHQATEAGYLVQKITQAGDYKTCKGVNFFLNRRPVWENFGYIESGQNPVFSDRWNGATVYPESKGSYLVHSLFKFIPERIMSLWDRIEINSWRTGEEGDFNSGSAGHTFTEPIWWDQAADESAEHQMSVAWDCCCKLHWSHASCDNGPFNRPH